MGHAVRSRVVLDHLVAEGHEIEIMASGRAVDFLHKHFEGVNRIHGLHMIYEENRVRVGKTLVSNVLGGAAGLPQNVTAYFELMSEFKPDLVISDFESWTYLFAKAHRIPVLSIDNMQIIHRCAHAPEILKGEETSFQLAKAFVKGKLPFCDAYFVTTFFTPPTRKPNTHLFPPILRSEVIGATPTTGDHLLVYQTAEGYDTLVESLTALQIECRIYGMRRGITQEQREGNLRYMPFSESAFVDDLASSRGVIAGGGFTLMGEAVYLHKPMLAIPLGKQFEQVMNARYLEQTGFGMAAEGGTDSLKALGALGPHAPQLFASFVAKIPEYASRLASYHQDGNTLLFRALDEMLDRAAAGLL